jgi:hypothetical protein
MFPCSHGTIFDGTDQENSKTQGGRGQIRKIQENKKEIIEERKRREEIFAYVEVPILVCLPLVGDARGYHPCVTLRQENPLIWEPSLQHHKIVKKTGSSCPPHKYLHTSNNTSDSIKSHVQLPQAIIILFIVFVKGE